MELLIQDYSSVLEEVANFHLRNLLVLFARRANFLAGIAQRFRRADRLVIPSDIDRRSSQRAGFYPLIPRYIDRSDSQRACFFSLLSRFTDQSAAQRTGF